MWFDDAHFSAIGHFFQSGWLSFLLLLVLSPKVLFSFVSALLASITCLIICCNHTLLLVMF